MRFEYKIVALVGMQIILLATSFAAIIHFESQTDLVGNAVNIAGKNRLLTSQVQEQITTAMLLPGGAAGSEGGAAALMASALMDDLGDNITFLKDGGEVDGVELAPLPERFEGDWLAVRDKFDHLQEVVESMSVDDSAAPEYGIIDMRRISGELLALSDSLATRLGHDVEDLSHGLMDLQIALGAVNMASHVIMVVIVWKVFKGHTEYRVRMERFATIGQFASIMAHDMRTPLGTISNSLITLRSRNAAGPEMDRMDRAVRRISHQIQGVLSYVRTTPLAVESITIQEILQEALASIKVPDGTVVSLPDDDVRVACDPDKMEFVFSNLLLNAVQSIAEGKGADKSIRVGIRQDAVKDEDGAVVVEFENTGPAIPAGDAPRVFDPLFTTRMRGTGLGLTSCRNIVEAHGGDIKLESTDPVRFVVSLPTGGSTGDE